MPSTDTKLGWMPGVVQVKIPDSNFSKGNKGRKAVVLHIIVGSYRSALSEFANPTKRKSSHFVVSKAGDIAQCVSVFDTAYANGLSWDTKRKCWIDPEGAIVRPPWPGLQPPINPNFQTISIEREGQPQDVPTPAMDAATLKVLRFVANQFPTSFPVWSAHQNLIGHCDISPINRSFCPGPHVDFAAIAAQLNAPIIPAPLPRYRTRVATPIFEDRRGDARLALQIEGQPGPETVLPAGAVVEVDDVRNGFLHIADGRGFAPIGCFEPLQ